MILLILKTTRTGRTLISSASSASRTAMSAPTSSPTAAAGRPRSAASSTSSAATPDSTVYEAMLNGVWKDKEMVDDKYTGGWFWEVEDLDGRFYICLNVPGEVNV